MFFSNVPQTYFCKILNTLQKALFSKFHKSQAPKLVTYDLIDFSTTKLI